MELPELDIQKELACGQERNRLQRETGNGAWLSAVTHRLNDTELSWEEFRDNLHLRYGLMSQDRPTTCSGCGRRLLIEHALSCSKGDLVLEQHDDAAKEWDSLGSRDLVPSAISYKPKIKSRTVQGEMSGAGVKQDGGTSDGGVDIL